MKKEDLKINNETNIKCPKCKIFLLSILLHNTEVDYCPKCLGIWFEEDELRLAKDEKDKDLEWLDIDLWEDESKLKVVRGIRMCPSCRVPLYEIRYGDSNIIVDVCRLCRGVWLDRGEFRWIIDWLKSKAKYKVMNEYSKVLLEEFSEVFSGPETIREEMSDFLTVLKLLNYKMVVKYPKISYLISSTPK